MNLKKMQTTDAMVALYVLVSFIMLIVPLPSWLLDVFMAFNMAVSFTILFVCMFVQEVLDNPDEDFKVLIENALDKSGKYYDNDDYDCFNRIYDSLFSLNDDEIGSGGYVVASLEVALYSCYHTGNYKEAVLRAVNYGGDTDTNAIIAGGLAAVYYGFDSIPEEWLDTVIRLDYIKDLCDNFYKSLK